jgi:hypothetical protein
MARMLRQKALELLEKLPSGFGYRMGKEHMEAIKIATRALRSTLRADGMLETKKPTVFPGKQKVHKPRKAVVISDPRNPHCLAVRDEFGHITLFVRGSIHYPGDLKVGTKGTIQYVVSGSMGLDWFTPEAYADKQ